MKYAREYENVIYTKDIEGGWSQIVNKALGNTPRFKYFPLMSYEQEDLDSYLNRMEKKFLRKKGNFNK